MSPAVFEQLPACETVFDRLQWQAQLRANGEEDRSTRAVLLIMGGAMRGVAGAGAVNALQEKGLMPGFDAVVGISTGAGIAPYALAPKLGAEAIYHEKLPDKIIQRRWPWVNVEAVINEIRDGEYAVDNQAVAASPTELYFGATDQDGEFELLDAKKHNMFDVMRASMTIPYIAGKPVEIDGKHYTDGGYGDDLPVKKIVEELGATDLVIISHLSEKIFLGGLRVGSIGNFVIGLAEKYLTPAQKLLLPPIRRQIKQAEYAYMRERTQSGDLRVSFLHTEEPVGGFERNPQLLERAYINCKNVTGQLLANIGITPPAPETAFA